MLEIHETNNNVAKRRVEREVNGKKLDTVLSLFHD